MKRKIRIVSTLCIALLIIIIPIDVSAQTKVNASLTLVSPRQSSSTEVYWEFETVNKTPSDVFRIMSQSEGNTPQDVSYWYVNQEIEGVWTYVEPNNSDPTQEGKGDSTQEGTEDLSQEGIGDSVQVSSGDPAQKETGDPSGENTETSTQQTKGTSIGKEVTLHPYGNAVQNSKIPLDHIEEYVYLRTEQGYDAYKMVENRLPVSVRGKDDNAFIALIWIEPVYIADLSDGVAKDQFQWMEERISNSADMNDLLSIMEDLVIYRSYLSDDYYNDLKTLAADKADTIYQTQPQKEDQPPETQDPITPKDPSSSTDGQIPITIYLDRTKIKEGSAEVLAQLAIEDGQWNAKEIQYVADQKAPIVIALWLFLLTVVVIVGSNICGMISPDAKEKFFSRFRKKNQDNSFDEEEKTSTSEKTDLEDDKSETSESMDSYTNEDLSEVTPPEKIDTVNDLNEGLEFEKKEVGYGPGFEMLNNKPEYDIRQNQNDIQQNQIKNTNKKRR